jgi:hypothetical protein
MFVRKMKKKISILTLAIVFLASTTGMLFTMHYCKMMELASFESCEVCVQESEKTSCCEENAGGSYFTSESGGCCNDLLVDNSIKENFISSKNELVSSVNLLSIIPGETVLNTNQYVSSNINFSPPKVPGNKIYLNNSILLI